MEQREVLLLEKGQPKLLETMPKAPQAMHLIWNERINMAFVLSELAAMHKGSKLQDINFSYMNGDVFKGMTEEKFVSKLNPVEFFKETLGQIKKKTAGIEDVKVDCTNNVIAFKIQIQKPDWDLEELIYRKYQELLKQYKGQSFDITIEQFK